MGQSRLACLASRAGAERWLAIGETRDEWCARLEDTDACFAPVLTYEESLDHPHMLERGTYVEANGLKQAAPAPRFSRTPGDIGAGGDGRALLDRWPGAEPA